MGGREGAGIEGGGGREKLEGDLAVDRTSEEEDVQECGVGEAPQSTNALQRQPLQLRVLLPHCLHVELYASGTGRNSTRPPVSPSWGACPANR